MGIEEAISALTAFVSELRVANANQATQIDLMRAYMDMQSEAFLLWDKECRGPRVFRHDQERNA